MTKTPTYVRFLQLADGIRIPDALEALDPLEDRILTTVARANARKERLCVRDLMSCDEFGAPATIHGRISSMREKGWLQLADTPDARRKQVELTPQALQHFERLSRAMAKAVAGAVA